MQNIFYNNTIYHLNGKSFYKFDMEHQYKALKVEKEEKRNIIKFIESRKQDIFKSDRLNKIAKLNPALKNIERIEDILGEMERIIPEKLRKNFYENLETVKIYFIEYYSEKERSTQGTYRPTDNSIVIYTPEYIKQDYAEDYNVIIIATLIHELYHLSASKCDEENHVSKSGIEYFIGYNEKDVTEIDKNLKKVIINTPLNEGITSFYEQVTLTVLNINGRISYPENLAIAMQLFFLIDKSTIEKSYFNQLGTFYIQKDLNKIINDPAKCEYLIYILNNIDIKRYKVNNYYHLLQAENLLIDYFETKIIKLINSNQVDKAIETYLGLIENYNLIFGSETFSFAKSANENFKNIEITIRRKAELIKKQFINVNIIARTRKNEAN